MTVSKVGAVREKTGRPGEPEGVLFGDEERGKEGGGIPPPFA